MTSQKRKEIVIFLVTLAVLAVTFSFGIFYVRANEPKASSDVLAFASSTDVAVSSSAAIQIPAGLPTSTTALASSSNATTTNVVAKNKPSAATTTSNDIAAASVGAPPSPTPTPAQLSSSQASTTPTVSSTAPAGPTGVALPYSIGTFGNQFAAGDGWDQWLWGSVSQDDGMLTIGANATGTGGGDLLVGSGDWTNYTFQAIVDWHFGQTFSLIARYVDDKNYLTCEFNEQTVGTVQVTFEQLLNGNETILASGNVPDYNQAGGVDINAAIQVNGNQGSCGFNGSAVSTYIAGNSIQSPSTSGGIGLIAWDPNINNSEIVVRSVGVSTEMYNLGPNTIQGIY